MIIETEKLQSEVFPYLNEKGISFDEIKFKSATKAEVDDKLIEDKIGVTKVSDVIKASTKYWEDFRSDEEITLIKFTLPSSKIRKTSGEGIPEAISLVEDLLLLGNGTVNTSADGQEAIITVTKAFWDGISEERKTEINGLIQLAGGSIG